MTLPDSHWFHFCPGCTKARRNRSWATQVVLNTEYYNTVLFAVHSICKANTQGTSATEPPKHQVWGKLITKVLKEGYSVRVPCQIKMKCGLFMNRGCKFMDQDPSSQPLCQTAAAWFGCSLGWESSAACAQGGNAGISPVYDTDSEPVFLGPAVQQVQHSLP